MTSLVGRFIRAVTLFGTVLAFLATAPAQAAPFAAIVMDARSGETLWEKNADTRLHPASLTKMMTLYIAFQEIEAGRLSLDTVVTVSKNAAAQPPSRLGLKPGQKIKLRYLIRAAAIKSANDAASAIGDHIGGGSEAAFAKRMTKTARALGMKNTTFKNANGLTAEGHLSTARDMTFLGRHLFYDFPQYYNIFSRRSADAGMATVRNTNSRFLDGYEGADGIKTGYTVAAGFNLTASAKRGDKRIIATVFGGASTPARNAKMVELMDMGFKLAKNGAKVRAPEAAPPPADVEGPDDLLIAEAVNEAINGVDQPGVEGGSAKTIRVSGEVTRSIRPKARPGVAAEAPVAVAAAAVEDDVALAIAAGVADAMAEATAEPPPAGTLEAQAVELAVADPVVDATQTAVAEGILAEVVPPAPAPAPGSLEAQAAALAAGVAPAETPAPSDSVNAQVAALAESIADPSLAGLRPQRRPETLTAAVVAEADVPPLEVAEAAPALETVAPAAVATEAPLAVAMAAPAPAPAAPAMVTAIETVAADASAPMPLEEVAPAGRKAPIFDSVEVAEAPAEPAAEELVVVSKSTSGDSRHWSVNVGSYTSRHEAERALVKTGLAESATLDQGLRKITQSGGKYHASFLGLAEDQADLACRRIRARGISCETLSPG